MMRRFVILLFSLLISLSVVSAFDIYPYGNYDFSHVFDVRNVKDLSSDNFSLTNAPYKVNIGNTFLVYWNGSHSVSREINYSGFPYLETVGYIKASDWTNVSIVESQISDMPNYALNSTLNTHTDNSDVHFTQSTISITESQISDLTHTIDTNETTRMNNIAGFTCTSGNFVSSFGSNSLPVCSTPPSGGESYNYTNDISFTIDADADFEDSKIILSTEDSFSEIYIRNGFGSLADLNIGNLFAQGGIIPYLNNSYDIGHAGGTWSVGYINDIRTNKINTTIGDLDLDSSSKIIDVNNNNITAVNCIVFSSGGQICSV